jgi:hypothetical protein
MNTTFYGLADSRLAGSGVGEAVELDLREDAEAALRDVLRDEPMWQGQLPIVALDFSREKARVASQ